MTTWQPGQSNELLVPSYKELRSDGTHILFSPATKRLFWPLDVQNLLSPTSNQTPKEVAATWHEISQLPLTEPKVFSIEASIYDLEQWEFDWMAWHGEHVGGEFEPQYVTYGDLSDEDRPYANEAKEDGSWEEDEDKEFLVRCCGEERPLGKRGMKLVVTPSMGNHFVTVDDYASAVHPWLMSFREDILKAKTVARPLPYSALVPTVWMVSKGPEHKIEEKEKWIRENGGGPPRTMPASGIAILDRIRASRNR